MGTVQQAVGAHTTLSDAHSTPPELPEPELGPKPWPSLEKGPEWLGAVMGLFQASDSTDVSYD